MRSFKSIIPACISIQPHKVPADGLDLFFQPFGLSEVFIHTEITRLFVFVVNYHPFSLRTPNKLTVLNKNRTA